MAVSFPDLAVDFCLIFFPITYFFLKKMDFKKELGFFSNGLKKDVKNTIVLFFALAVFSILASFITSALGVNDLQKVAQNIEQIITVDPLAIWYFLIVRVFAEEVFFRGFLVKKTGAIGSSFLFGLAHLAYGSVAEVFGAIVLGFVLAKAFEQNKNIAPNFFAHFFYNMVFLIIFITP